MEVIGKLRRKLLGATKGGKKKSTQGTTNPKSIRL